jgi:hypothetical protein
MENSCVMASFWLWLPPLDPALHAILRGFVATAVAKQWWSHLARIFEIASFEVHGPFKIDYEKRRGGRTLVFDEFWSKDADASYLAKERGSYVFAVRNRGLTPIYVGNRTGSGVGKGVLSSPIECHGIGPTSGPRLRGASGWRSGIPDLCLTVLIAWSGWYRLRMGMASLLRFART